jgi:hypothetical protein
MENEMNRFLAEGKGHVYTIDFSLALQGLPPKLAAEFGNGNWPSLVLDWISTAVPGTTLFFLDPNWGSQDSPCKIGIRYTKTGDFVWVVRMHFLKTVDIELTPEGVANAVGGQFLSHILQGATGVDIWAHAKEHFSFLNTDLRWFAWNPSPQ